MVLKKPPILISILFACSFILVVIAHLLFSKFLSAPGMSGDALSTDSQTEVPSPTPFPFQELTIPYLANREYRSVLSDRSVYRDNGSYTSYLTSYSSDGLKIQALLTIPNRETPAEGFPAVVFVHGYIPPTQYQTTEKYESYVEYLARNGLVVLKIDLRGHGDSQGEASGAYYSGDYVIDVLNAYEALRSAVYVDSNRVGLWGHSMAGNVILRAVAAQKTIPKAVIWAGAVYTYEDFIEYRISDGSYTPPAETSNRRKKRDELIELYGSFSQDSWFWQKVPATHFLDGIQTAFQFHHAVNDNVVSVEYSRNLARILAETPIDFETYEYASGGHNISGQAFSEAMERTVEFFLR